MYKKATADIPLFATENEFHTLLAIHNEIKKGVYKMFPYIKEQIIETLFSILSSQALLYDQIIRKSVLLQGSMTKQTQITKLVEGNKAQFEKKIQEHLNSFNTSCEYRLSDTKTGTQEGKLTNQSKEDSIVMDQESIFAKLKKKIKLGKNNQHIRTNSAGITFNQFETEEIKKKPKTKHPPLTEKKESKLLKPRQSNANKKHIVFSKEKQIYKYKNINLHLDKDNYRSNTQDSFYPYQQNRKAPFSQTKYPCLTERKNSDKDFLDRDVKLYPLLSYQSFPINKDHRLKRIGSKPTKYTKYLLKKYHDVVDSYEKFETEEDEILRQNLFHSQIISRTDFNKKTNEMQNSTQSFIITDYNKSKNKPKSKSKSKSKNRNASCGNKLKPKIISNAWK